MKCFNFRLIILLSTTTVFLTCGTQTSKSNEFNIYANENIGWQIVDLKYDSIHKDLRKISVKFEKGQTFQTANIRSLNLRDYQITILHQNGDTAKSEFWFKGEYHFDSLQRIFVHFYVPTKAQQRTIKNYIKDPIYDSLCVELENIIYSYLKEGDEIK